MQEDTEKIRSNTQSGGQFIDTLIGQWMKRTGTDIALLETEKRMVEPPASQENKQLLQNQDWNIQILLRKLKQSQREEVSLSSTLEIEMRYKEEIQTKLNATWESIDTITEYYNYISESLASFQQHRVNLSNLYDNVILKQQEHIQKLQLSNVRLKDLEKHLMQLENELILRERRLQEATTEQNKLQKQLEDSVRELQSQKNGLTNAYAEEKSTLVKEQQRLLLEYENLQLRLQTVENDKCDIAKSAAQLQDKLVFQEEKIQAVLREKDKLQKQLENTNSEFYMQKNKLASEHIEEKRKFVEEQQRLLIECESLQSQLNILQQEKSNITETVAEKDALISKLLKENSMYKNEIEVMISNNNEVRNKYEALEEEQNIWEKKLRAKTEKIQNLETALNATKQKETRLVNDVNRMEKKLTDEMNYSKNLECKLSNTKIDLQNTEMQNVEMQEMLKHSKVDNELANNELAKINQKLKILQQEKEEVAKREITCAKNTDILYENLRVKHVEEVSALTSSYETRLLDLKKTIDCLKEASDNTIQENSTLKKSLTEMKNENVSLKNDYQFVLERNRNLHDKLKEVTEMSRMKLIDAQEPKKNYLKDKTQLKEKSEHKMRFDEVMEILEDDQSDVSTSANFKSRILDLGDNKHVISLSQPVNRTSVKRESLKEQEEEVTSAGKKFFKSRPTQPRTYSKRR